MPAIDQQPNAETEKPQPRQRAQPIEPLRREVEEHRKQYTIANAVETRMCWQKYEMAVGHKPVAKRDFQCADSKEKPEEASNRRLATRSNHHAESKEQIAMLFNSQTPGMRNAADIVLDIEQVAPEERKGAVPSKKHDGEIKVVLRPDFEATTDEETFAVDATAHFPLLHKQAADKESAENKENVDANNADMVLISEPEAEGSERRTAGVKVHHHQDGNAANEVELDLAMEGLRAEMSRRVGLCHAHGGGAGGWRAW